MKKIHDYSKLCEGDYVLAVRYSYSSDHPLSRRGVFGVVTEGGKSGCIRDFGATGFADEVWMVQSAADSFKVDTTYCVEQVARYARPGTVMVRNGKEGEAPLFGMLMGDRSIDFVDGFVLEEDESINSYEEVRIVYVAQELEVHNEQ